MLALFGNPHNVYLIFTFGVLPTQQAAVFKHSFMNSLEKIRSSVLKLSHRKSFSSLKCSRVCKERSWYNLKVCCKFRDKLNFTPGKPRLNLQNFFRVHKFYERNEKYPICKNDKGHCCKNRVAKWRYLSS